jgi:predicted O-methyltransferase YrrM
MKSFQNKILFNKYKKYICNKTIPGMTCENELAFLRYYAENKYTGTGEIVDLGCWFGATSIALAQGLKITIVILRKAQDLLNHILSKAYNLNSDLALVKQELESYD